MTEPLPALTVRPRPARCVAAGIRPVVNRTWTTTHRGLVAIHAGVSPTSDDWPQLDRLASLRLDDPDDTTGEVFVGLARLVDVERCSGGCSPWALPGWFHWRFAEPLRLAAPIPCRGGLGLWTVPAAIAARVWAAKAAA